MVLAWEGHQQRQAGLLRNADWNSAIEIGLWNRLVTADYVILDTLNSFGWTSELSC